MFSLDFHTRFIPLMLPLLALPLITHAALCPPDGPLLPRPTTLSTFPSIHDASCNLTATLDAAIAGNLSVPWFIPNISFSIALVSLDTTPSDPLWEYHHSAANNVHGTKHADVGFPEIFYLVPAFQSLGFPHIPNSEFPNCNIIGLNPGCTRQQLFQNLISAPPVSTPNLHPVYSTLAFALISFATVVATGKNYSTLIQEEIVGPLAMTNTGVSPGIDDRAVIPPVEDSWGSDYADNAPGGGLFSSTHDISSLLLSLISTKSNNSLLTKAEAHLFLKPISTTTRLSTLVGRPWEIYRTQNLTPEHPHTIDIYTKGGTAIGYQASMGVIDQYGIGYVVLTAGGRGTEAQGPLVDALLSTFMPSIETRTREESRVYTGTYTGGEDEMIVAIDQGPGLRILNLTRNGTDMLESIKTLFENQPVNIGRLTGDWRLYPTDVTREVERGIEQEWRLQYDALDDVYESDLPRLYERERFCGLWFTGGALFYGGESADRFIFLRDGEGRVTEAIIPSLRLNLTLQI